MRGDRISDISLEEQFPNRNRKIRARKPAKLYVVFGQMPRSYCRDLHGLIHRLYERLEVLVKRRRHRIAQPFSSSDLSRASRALLDLSWPARHLPAYIIQKWASLLWTTSSSW